MHQSDTVLAHGVVPLRTMNVRQLKGCSRVRTFNNAYGGAGLKNQDLKLHTQLNRSSAHRCSSRLITALVGFLVLRNCHSSQKDKSSGHCKQNTRTTSANSGQSQTHSQGAVSKLQATPLPAPESLRKMRFVRTLS